MPKIIFQIRKNLHIFWFISIRLISKDKIYLLIILFFNRLVYLLFTPKLSLYPILLLFFKTYDYAMTHSSFT